jgi:hypothetical protein
MKPAVTVDVNGMDSSFVWVVNGQRKSPKDFSKGLERDLLNASSTSK